MAYRTMLVITLQALQQLTGASFFYYGTSVLRPLDSQTSYVTNMILGSANFGITFPGLYIVERFGRRPSLIAGALWMFMCFMVRLFRGTIIVESLIESPGLHFAQPLRS